MWPDRSTTPRRRKNGDKARPFRPLPWTGAALFPPDFKFFGLDSRKSGSREDTSWCGGGGESYKLTPSPPVTELQGGLA